MFAGRRNIFFYLVLLLLGSGIGNTAFGQESKIQSVKKAGKKIQKGIEINNNDTLAQGYFDLAETYYRTGELEKSEGYYQKSKNAFEKNGDAAGVAKSSRALGNVQEALHKDKAALNNYLTAQDNNLKTGDVNSGRLNSNDASRLRQPDSLVMQENLINKNIRLGIANRDSAEIAGGYSKLAEIGKKQNNLNTTLWAYNNAYKFSQTDPQKAVQYNQLLTNTYLSSKNFSKAIETKENILNEKFVKNSTLNTANEISSLADIYILKKEDSTAIRLLNESYELSVKNGHTLEAKRCVEKLDSIFQDAGAKEKSLALYKSFLEQLPAVIGRDSSLIDNAIIEETEKKLKKLEVEKALKDDLIREKIRLNYWLIGSVIVLVIFITIVLLILKKLRIQNKKIALQSLRREMNPHFIFNSLNSINQFIANNNELEANQYLTKFSTLMRRVMENSKNDFILFSKEIELLKNYLELEKSRFSDKFDFTISIDDALYEDEQLFVPGMLIQPHLENAIWHGLRYSDAKGFLKLSFVKRVNVIEVLIEDNGIGIAESQKHKTVNQQQQSGRGINNTMERIKILNDLYHQNITCTVEDKLAPASGVKVTLDIPLLKTNEYDS